MSQAAQGGGDNLSSRPCPMCGQPTKSLGNHLRHCSGSGETDG